MFRWTIPLLLFLAAPAFAATELEVLDLRPEWVVGEDDEDEVLFGVISSLDVAADGTLYVLDRQLTEINAFDRDGTWLGPVGREGEGPGEYHRIGDVFVSAPGVIGVVQRMPGRIVSVNVDGTPGPEIPLPAAFTSAPAYFFGAGRAGEDLVLQARRLERTDGGVRSTSMLVRIDPVGEEIARLAESEFSQDMANFTVDERENSPVVWAADADGLVYVSDRWEGYEIRVVDASGATLRTLRRDYLPRVRSETEREVNTPRMAIRGRGGGRRDARGIPSPTDRDVQNIYPRPDGSLWVLTSRGAFEPGEGLLAVLDVFDAKGEFSHQAALKGPGDLTQDGLHIHGDRVFVTRGLRAAERASRGAGDGEDDAEPMAIACFTIQAAAGSVAGSR